MTIIKIEALESGIRPIESQSHRRACWLPGYIEVPPNLEQAAWESGGWCDLTIENGKLVSLIPTERAPEPEPESQPPTELEQLRADVDYLSVMTGVMLV